VQSTRPAPERISVVADAPAPSLLVISEHFDPGWRATVDGQPARRFEVDLSALGVALPAGRHAVELRFWPRGLTAGLWTWAATLAGFLVAGFALRRRAA
jgi:uncharacterized membrane protein YfhO